MKLASCSAISDGKLQVWHWVIIRFLRLSLELVCNCLLGGLQEGVKKGAR